MEGFAIKAVLTDFNDEQDMTGIGSPFHILEAYRQKTRCPVVQSLAGNHQKLVAG